MKLISSIAFLGILALVVWNGNTAHIAKPKVAVTPLVLGTQTKTGNCQSNGPLPDPSCTPGAIFPQVTKDQICTKGYSGSVRNVSVATKKEVYAEYGITHHATGEYEVDHFISLELGGSNDLANLWPEPANPTPGFHQKDLVENYLHEQVCNGVMSLSDAQQKISHDWLSVYTNVHNIQDYGYQGGK